MWSLFKKVLFLVLLFQACGWVMSWKSVSGIRSRAFQTAVNTGLDVVGGGAVFKVSFTESITVVQASTCHGIDCVERTVLAYCDPINCKILSPEQE